MNGKYTMLLCHGLVCFCFMLANPPVSAADDWPLLAYYALEAERRDLTPAFPWLDGYLNLEPADITRADGVRLMDRPRIAHSRYDQSVQHNISRFYKPKNPRMNLTMHYAGRRAGEIISLGIDTGFSAKKITIKPALYLGYTRAFQVAERTHFALGLSGWLGGKVSEKPCRDAYDRKYYCPTLTAWSDYRPPDNSSKTYVSLVFDHAF